MTDRRLPTNISVNDNIWEKFKQTVARKRGLYRGNNSLVLEELMLEYIDKNKK